MARTRRGTRDYADLSKDDARQILLEQVRYGRIHRPRRCEECGMNPGRGTDGRTLLQAHHDDYRRPLDVRWLCVGCHDAIDRPGTLGEGRDRVSLQTRIRPELYEGVKATARRIGVTRVTLVEAALRAYLDALDALDEEYRNR